VKCAIRQTKNLIMKGEEFVHSPKNCTHIKKKIGISNLKNSDVNAGVDVTITIFCNFCQISGKNLHFSQKPML
jgi:hypothetical protein